MRDGTGFAARGASLRPGGLHDLRTGPMPSVLRYGASDLLVVTGLPGAGKSTLMARCAHAPLVDSQHVREKYQERLPSWLPYPAFRPLVRGTHYLGLVGAMRAGGPLVIHDCGTVPAVRSWVVRAARRQNRGLHLLFIDADPVDARAGQLARGRALPVRQFDRHRVVAQRTRERLSGASGPPPGWSSAVLVSRAGARYVEAITFGTAPRVSAGPPK
ncbi:ATP-binding protein [Yinghuangia sp. ASG 101]|uniref:AAA family ATPase n=1 Tax=Yinghuangia sp. ASG 101 TaxID=2896848 RepID=UPI001E3DC97B|nr:AAA family ATPase [Yinghuangia sp. ASG 101]UGQ12748.1 ATP-binding protein [Yinghuangia sp. ASG 101]